MKEIKVQYKNPFLLQLPICERICSQLLQNVLKCKNNVNCKNIKHQKHLHRILHVNNENRRFNLKK